MSRQVNSLSDVGFQATTDQTEGLARGFVHTVCLTWPLQFSNDNILSQYLPVANPRHVSCVAGERLMLHVVLSICCQHLAVYSP